MNPNSQFFAFNIAHDHEPSNYKEAALDPAWQTTMTQEFTILHNNDTWSLMPLPAGKKAIGCMWVYKIKHKADESVERYKARLVVKGYTQHHGIDYTKKFSPVVKMTIVRILIAIAAKKQWDMYQLDINNAFVHGDLHEEVYMDVPSGLDVPHAGLLCKLNKFLYSLKQTSGQWYEKLTTTLGSRGYTHSHDYSLFYIKRRAFVVFLEVYVDDILLTSTNSEEITHLKSFLNNQFRIKDVGKLHYFLGLEIMYKSEAILISQRKFVQGLLKEFHCDHLTFLTSPLDPTVKLKAHLGKPLCDPTCIGGWLGN